MMGGLLRYGLEWTHMPVTLDIRENGHVVHYVLSGQWQPRDLMNLYDEEWAYRASVNHPVHALMDLRKMANVPPGVLTVRKGAPTLLHRNDSHFVLVGANVYAQAVAETIFKLTHYTKAKFVATEEEAWAYLRQIIAQECVQV
jgi:hypothetical protein